MASGIGATFYTSKTFIMSKILSLKHVTTGEGRPMIIVSTVDRDHWVTFNQWTKSKGYSAILDPYVGGQFEADYFKAGDELISGDIVDTDDIIIRDFVATMNPVIVAHLVHVEAQAAAAQRSDAATLFQRRRSEETAEAKAARLAARAARLAGANTPAPAVTPAPMGANPEPAKA